MKILFLISILLFSTELDEYAEDMEVNYNQLSEEFLVKAIKGESTKEVRTLLSTLSYEELSDALDHDTKRIAFWVNIYNAYVQHFLRKNPAAFDNTRKFFSSNQIRMFDRNISLEKIEHGIIRRSQWKLGLGRIPALFPPKFERCLRLDKREPRVHFVLNCGAKSCPPVIVLTPAKLEEQLTSNTKAYLEATSQYNNDNNEVNITPLFNWFRGDFGGKSGIRRMLQQYDVIPPDSRPKLKWLDYDWTLDVDNYTL